MKWRHRLRAHRGCSSVRHRGERPPLLQPRRHRGCGRSSRTALAINAVGDAPEYILDHTSAGIGIELIEGYFSTQRPVGGAEPFDGFIAVADHLDSMGVYARHTDRA